MDQTQPDRPLVSICIPVKNGEGRLEHCLASIRALEYPQDRIEIIIADGRSTDRTAEIARSFSATVLDNPQQTAASGRNVAYDAARGDFICSADDDCVLPPSWIDDALAGFSSDKIAAVGGLTPVPPTSSAWEIATDVIFQMAGIVGYSIQSKVGSRGEVRDLPGGCVFYRRSVWQAVRPFDTGLITAEDTDLHLRMFMAGMKMVYAPGFFAWHHKRSTPQGLFRQMRRFAQGRVQLDRKFPGSARFMHRLVGWSLPLMIVALTVLAIIAPIALVGLAILGIAVACIAGFSAKAGLPAVALTPVAALIFAMGWSTGWIRETLAPMASTTGR